MVIIGRGDVWDGDNTFFKNVDDMVQVAQSQNPDLVVVLAAILPGVSDTWSMINAFTFRNEKLAFKCTGSSKLHFARPGKNLLASPGGPIADYYNEFGDINQRGQDVVRRAIERKLLTLGGAECK